MEINHHKAFSLLILAVLPVSTLAATGTPDNGRHPFAGALSIRRPALGPEVKGGCFRERCGAFLVDTTALTTEMGDPMHPNLNNLQGRVVVTAAHCIQYDKVLDYHYTDPVTGEINPDNEIIVTFADNPQWFKLGDDPNHCDNVGDNIPFYRVVKAFYDPTFSDNYANVGGNIGMEVNDFGLLILEEPVAEFTDKALLNHPSTAWYKRYKFKADFPGGIVGTAGYGLAHAG